MSYLHSILNSGVPTKTYPISLHSENEQWYSENFEQSVNTHGLNMNYFSIWWLKTFPNAFNLMAWCFCIPPWDLMDRYLCTYLIVFLENPTDCANYVLETSLVWIYNNFGNYEWRFHISIEKQISEFRVFPTKLDEYNI